MPAGPRSLAARWRRRRRDRRDDTGSMPLAMLVTLVGVTLSAGLGGVVVDQFHQSQRLADRVAAVEAAQAGLDAGLKGIRDTFNVTGALLNKLPCGVLTPPTDPARNPFAALGKSTSATPTYSTTVGYFLTDPTDLVSKLEPLGPLTNINVLAQTHDLTGLLTGLSSKVTDAAGLNAALGTAVACANADVNGIGGALPQVPLYGLLRSEGRVGTTKRVLYATYTFRTSEDNILGGRIVVSGTNNPTKLCLGAVAADPKAGQPVQAVPCTSPNPQTVLIYPSNLSLQLSNSRKPKANLNLTGTAPTTTYTYGLCITATTFTDGADVKFQECVAPKLGVQQWSYDVNAQTYYANDGLSGTNRFCLNAADNTTNAKIVVRKGTSCGAANVNQHSFQPEASVGPGGAGPKSQQLVSFQEIGRCLDLTNENVNNPIKALITYPCKQTFTGSVFWNHKWSTPAIVAPAYKASGQISTQPPGLVPYCLKSPGVNNGFVWVGKCSDGGASLQWTIYEYAPEPKDRYQIVDSGGLCLMPAGSLGASFKFSGQWSEVVVATCNGSELQKWNMPTAALLSPLTQVKER